eukprot:528949-Prymnesium_polylepis.1
MAARRRDCAAAQPCARGIGALGCAHVQRPIGRAGVGVGGGDGLARPAGARGRKAAPSLVVCVAVRGVGPRVSVFSNTARGERGKAGGRLKSFVIETFYDTTSWGPPPSNQGLDA